MANKTSFLELVQPQNGEYVDNWEIPVNDNSAKVDLWAKGINDEIQTARGSKTTLSEYLSVGHDASGNLLPTPEMGNARNSPVYDNRDAEGLYVLKQRLDAGDWESFYGREGASGIKDNFAAHHIEGPYLIEDGGKDSNGYPTWLGFAVATTTVTVPPTLKLLIGGHRCHIRSNTSLLIEGATGTKYLHAQYQPEGVAVVDKSTDFDGITSNDDIPEARIFSDGGITDYQVEGVQVGDILEILNTDDAGKYIVKEVGYQGSGDPAPDYTKLVVTGIFPTGGLTGIQYRILDPMAVTLGYGTSETTDADKLTIAELDFNEGPPANITAVRPRHFKKTFVGEWRPVDVGSAPSFEEIWDHKLGTDLLDVSVQVSSANDGSQPVEELSLADLSASFTLSKTQDDLAVNVGTLGLTGSIDRENTLDLTTGDQSITGDVTVNNGDLDISGNPALTGDIIYELAASVVLTRSAKVKWTKNRIWVKNSVSGKFYKDYAGTEKTTGFIRVIIRKRG
jgi:hypothetical protein